MSKTAPMRNNSAQVIVYLHPEARFAFNSIADRASKPEKRVKPHDLSIGLFERFLRKHGYKGPVRAPAKT